MKVFKATNLLFAFLTLSALFPNPTFSQKPLPSVQIGIIVDGPWEQNDHVRNLFIDEVTALLQNEFDVSFPPDKSITCDWTLAGIKKAIDTLLNDTEVNFIIGSGAIVSQELALMGQLPKPCIAPFIVDALMQGVPEDSGTSGVKNLSYITSPWRETERLKMFRRVVPFSKLVILGSGPFISTLHNLTEYQERCRREMGIEIELIPVGYSVEEALNSIPADAEAVSVAPILHLDSASFQQLANGLIERKLPSFAVMGRVHVERGLMVGLLPETFFPKNARRTALNIQRILLGEKPEELPVVLPMNERLLINMSTARAIGKFPDWSVITEAELINEQARAVERQVDLRSVVAEALSVNLELLAKKFETEAGRENRRQAIAKLLPQIEVSALGAIIDKKLAESSFGTQAERTLTANATLQQILFSEEAWANVSIQKNLQKAQEYDEESFKLDVIQSAATAYLNVLVAKSLERIERENLAQTRENLELAQVREALGMSGTAEVLRWQGRLSSNRSSVISSNATRNQAELQLNRILNRALEESFLTEEVEIGETGLLIAHARFFGAMKNPWTFKLMRTFMEEEGINSTPELKQLDAAIAAQNRLYISSGRQFWLPTLALHGEVENLLGESGAGTSSPLAGVLPPGVSLTEPQGATWTLGMRASIPIFEGGARISERKQAAKTLEQLRLERSAIADKIGQRIRSALHQAGASYANIALSQEAADIADSTLDLVVDAYSRGAVSVLDLIDAQNNALIAEQSAAAAVYQFLIDMLEVERAIGKFDFMRSEEERNDFFGRLDSFVLAGDNKGND